MNVCSLLLNLFLQSSLFSASSRIYGCVYLCAVLLPLFLVLGVLIGGIQDGKWMALFWLVTLGPILLLTVFIHELGHAFTARRFGIDVMGILLWPLGGLAFVGHSSNPKGEVSSKTGPLRSLCRTGSYDVLPSVCPIFCLV